MKPVQIRLTHWRYSNVASADTLSIKFDLEFKYVASIGTSSISHRITKLVHNTNDACDLILSEVGFHIKQHLKVQVVDLQIKWNHSDCSQLKSVNRVVLEYFFENLFASLLKVSFHEKFALSREDDKMKIYVDVFRDIDKRDLRSLPLSMLFMDFNWNPPVKLEVTSDILDLLLNSAKYLFKLLTYSDFISELEPVLTQVSKVYTLGNFRRKLNALTDLLSDAKRKGYTELKIERFYLVTYENHFVNKRDRCRE